MGQMCQQPTIVAPPAQVMEQVRNMVGEGVSPSAQLMAAGLDSRGAMELRHHLGALHPWCTKGGVFIRTAF